MDISSPTPSDQQYALRWNDFQSSILSSFRHLRDEEDFVDVTLACDQRSFTAHKVYTLLLKINIYTTRKCTKHRDFLINPFFISFHFFPGPCCFVSSNRMDLLYFLNNEHNNETKKK
jgi:hypothetical protein